MNQKKSNVIMFLSGLALGSNKTFFLNHLNNSNNLILKSQPSKLEVFFTPGDECTERIVKHINNAKEEILVQAYSFTSKPIIDALIKKHKEGVKVLIILDKSQNNTIYTLKIISEGLKVLIDKLPGIAHNKVIIIDKKKVFTGSFNFSQAAQTKNAENSLLIENSEIVLDYLKNFSKRLKLSHKIPEKQMSKL